MYLQGVSTRRVTKVMETLCGFQVSSNQVSKATKKLDEQIEAWRTRPIEPMAHLVLDAMYEDVRYDKLVRRCAVRIAVGVSKSDGKRTILGVSVSLSEAEVHWRDFLRGLKERGLELPESITNDAHEGLRAALGTIFPASPWQRCQFHLQQNAQSYVPKVIKREEVAANIRDIFNAPGPEEAKLLVDKIIIKYQTSPPDLSIWMESALRESFTIFELPKAVHKRLHTSNMLENLNKQIRPRSHIVSIFPNKASCLRLISSILMEQSDDWESGRAYLTPKHLNEIHHFFIKNIALPYQARLVRTRATAAVAEKSPRKANERAQKQGETRSNSQRLRCQWHLIVTNIPVEVLKARAVCELYRCRWNIEIIFRVWNQSANLDKACKRRSNEDHFQALILSGMIYQVLSLSMVSLMRRLTSKKRLSLEKLFDYYGAHLSKCRSLPEIWSDRPDPRHVKMESRRDRRTLEDTWIKL
jgi:transposase-like protein